MRGRICNGGDVAHCRLAEALKAVGTSKAPEWASTKGPLKIRRRSAEAPKVPDSAKILKDKLITE